MEQTAETPAGKAKCRNPLERSVRVSSAQARGKRSCFAEYRYSHLVSVSITLLRSFRCSVMVPRSVALQCIVGPDFAFVTCLSSSQRM